MVRRTGLGRLALGLTAAWAALGGGAAIAQDAIPEMTIVIHNNSPDKDIYPLISFPGQTPDTWLQAYFKIPTAELANNRYASGGTTRMYVNCCNAGDRGIRPGQSVTLTLPLYSPLVRNIDPQRPNQLIEWWQGGNINLYETDRGAGQPAALLTHWNDATQKVPRIVGGAPECVAPARCNIFTSQLGNPIASEPQQLLEFTLGAAPVNPRNTRPGQPHFLFDPRNVDYDVSYVNTAYLPAVMEPYDNPAIGWIGTPVSIKRFNASVDKFLASRLADGWPLLVVEQTGKVVPGKIPSALEIFTQSVAGPTAPRPGDWVDPPKFRPNPKNSAPIKAMIKFWKDCQAGSAEAFCADLNAVTELMRANYASYTAGYRTRPEWNCDQDKDPYPSGALTDLQLLQHIYGWQPFVENCGARANLLQDTPGYTTPKASPRYQSVKNRFDRMQYSVDVLAGDYGVFHPYTALIHGPDYLDAEYTYAYSVDDAVGNMQTEGGGLVIAVGGIQNLPNPDHATPNIDFTYAYKSLSNKNRFVRYGICTDTPNRKTNQNFASFAIPIGVSQKATDCLISLEDNLGRIYKLKLDSAPDLRPTNWVFYKEGISADPEARKPIAKSCAMNTNRLIREDWCEKAFAYRERLGDARGTIAYRVVMLEPVASPPPAPVELTAR